LLSGVATGLSWLCYYRALQLAPASLVAPIDKLSVAFAIVLAVAVLEKVAWYSSVPMSKAFRRLALITCTIF